MIEILVERPVVKMQSFKKNIFKAIKSHISDVNFNTTF